MLSTNVANLETTLSTNSTLSTSDDTILVAFIYENDTAKDMYLQLLEMNGILTIPIYKSDVYPGIFHQFDAIIIGPDACITGNDYGSDDEVAMVENSSKPILGIDRGGLAFLWEVHAYCSWGHSMIVISSTEMVAVDSNHPVFSTPNTIPPGNITVSSHERMESIYMPTPLANVTPLAKAYSYTTYFPITLEADRYLYWGIEATPERWTQTGKQLFINTLIYLVSLGEDDSNGDIPGFEILYFLPAIILVAWIIRRKMSFYP